MTNKWMNGQTNTYAHMNEHIDEQGTSTHCISGPCVWMLFAVFLVPFSSVPIFLVKEFANNIVQNNERLIQSHESTTQ